MGVRRPKDETKLAEKKEEKKEVKKEIKRKKVIEGVRGIVRVAGVDLAGEKKIRNALLNVKGIGQSLAKAVPIAAGLNPDAMIGTLTDEQLKLLENVTKNPTKFGIPESMLNRRRDPITGENKHLIGSELTFANKYDIDLLKKIRSYKGIRHELGLPVRGQRTRSSFRKGMQVGVAKGAARAAQKAAAAPVAAKPEEKTPSTAKPAEKVAAKPEEKKEEKKQ